MRHYSIVSMTKYVILNEGKGSTSTETYKHPQGTKEFHQLCRSFALYHGVNLKTHLEGLVLSDAATGTLDELRDQARYVVSVDPRNQWAMQKNHEQGEEAVKPVHPETLAKIEEKYSSEREYRVKIRRFLKEEFLGLFLPFLNDSPMAYSPYSGFEGGINALGGLARAISCMIDDEHQMPTARVIRYLRGAQFYVSEDEFSLKGDRNSWASLPSIHIIRKAEDSDEYTYEFIRSSSGKLWANPLLSFSHQPEYFERFVEMLRRGPQGTTFAIDAISFETTRFFTAEDPVTMTMADYLSGKDGFKPNPAMNERIETMITSLRERQMLMHDPSLEKQLPEESLIEMHREIRGRLGT